MHYETIGRFIYALKNAYRERDEEKIAVMLYLNQQFKDDEKVNFIIDFYKPWYRKNDGFDGVGDNELKERVGKWQLLLKSYQLFLEELVEELKEMATVTRQIYEIGNPNREYIKEYNSMVHGYYPEISEPDFTSKDHLFDIYTEGLRRIKKDILTCTERIKTIERVLQLYMTRLNYLQTISQR